MKTISPTKIDTLFWESFETIRGQSVPEEWQKELYNYLVMGYHPGSFHTSLFAMDLMGAVSHSHISNTWEAISAFVRWVVNIAPPQSWGSYEKVDAWLKLSKKERTEILELWRLLSTEKEVAWNILAKSS